MKIAHWAIKVLVLATATSGYVQVDCFDFENAVSSMDRTKPAYVHVHLPKTHYPTSFLAYNTHVLPGYSNLPRHINTTALLDPASGLTLCTNENLGRGLCKDKKAGDFVYHCVENCDQITVGPTHGSEWDICIHHEVRQGGRVCVISYTANPKVNFKVVMWKEFHSYGYGEPHNWHQWQAAWISGGIHLIVALLVAFCASEPFGMLLILIPTSRSFWTSVASDLYVLMLMRAVFECGTRIATYQYAMANDVSLEDWNPAVFATNFTKIITVMFMCKFNHGVFGWRDFWKWSDMCVPFRWLNLGFVKVAVGLVLSWTTMYHPSDKGAALDIDILALAIYLLDQCIVLWDSFVSRLRSVDRFQDLEARDMYSMGHRLQSLLLVFYRPEDLLRTGVSTTDLFVVLVKLAILGERFAQVIEKSVMAHIIDGFFDGEYLFVLFVLSVLMIYGGDINRLNSGSMAPARVIQIPWRKGKDGRPLTMTIY